MDILHSSELGTEAKAREALHVLFDSITPTERVRMFYCLYFLAHKHGPPIAMDWSDKSGDGDLKTKPPGIFAATNGQS